MNDPTAPLTSDRHLDSALDWLQARQDVSGEIGAVASALDGGEPDWQPDALKFVTALVVLALEEVPDPRATTVVDRAVGFLLGEAETMAQWRYWAISNPQHWFTPPDADDTACCSMAVATRGHRTRRNRAVLAANRDAAGRFYTWLIPHGATVDPRAWWAMRDELRGSVRQLRHQLWDTTEANPDDVDGVVNANVIRYLADRAPEEAVRWVCSIVEEGREDDCDSWHRNRFTLYASIADAHRRGVVAFSRIGDAVVERIVDRIDDHGTVGPPLDSAFALLALCEFDGPTGARRQLNEGLRRSQLEDGSWARSVFYFGGPKEVFGWASEQLSTATAVQALVRSDYNDLGRRDG